MSFTLIKANRLLRNSLKSWFNQTFIEKVLENSHYAVVSKHNVPVSMNLLQTQVGQTRNQKSNIYYYFIFFGNFPLKIELLNNTLKLGKEAEYFLLPVAWAGKQITLSQNICAKVICGSESNEKLFSVVRTRDTTCKALKCF